MAGESFDFQSVIDIDTWNQAKWGSMVFLHDPDGNFPPVLAFGFNDATAGKKIFRDWKRIFGDEDVDELIRIAIIEGNLPKWDPGYFVTVGLDTSAYIEQMEQYESARPKGFLATVTRIHHMDTPNSPNLQNFKKEFAKHKEYGICPAHVPSNDVRRAEPYTDLVLVKKKIHFRKTSDVDKSLGTDPDTGIHGLK